MGNTDTQKTAGSHVDDEQLACAVCDDAVEFGAYWPVGTGTPAWKFLDLSDDDIVDWGSDHAVVCDDCYGEAVEQLTG